MPNYTTISLDFFAPSEKAPDFIKGNGTLMIKDKEKLLEYLQNPDVKNIPIQVLESRDGRLYLATNGYIKDTHKPQTKSEEGISIEDISF